LDEIEKMPSFGLFRKQKKQAQPEQTTVNVPEPQPAQTAPEAPVQESTPETPVEAAQESSAPEPVTAEPEQEPAPVEPEPAPVEPEAPVEAPPESAIFPAQTTAQSKAYLKAMPLRDLSDLEGIKNEVQNGNILILRITPLASKSIESVKSAVNDLYAFTESIGGDIARLGDERVVICPKNIRIWREKAPVKNAPPTTAA
jgi:SepF-like predicted cell division protein (DUF552 family)